MKKIFFSFILFTIFFSPFPSIASAEEVVVYFFKDSSCPYCQNQQDFLDILEDEVPQLEVRSIEALASEENKEFLLSLIDNYDLSFRGVPMTFIGNFPPLVGFDDSVASDIKSNVLYCLNNYCPDPVEEAGLEDFFASTERKIKTAYYLPFLGQYDFAETPLLLMTSIIAFVDGFNPCSLWLISFLLAIAVYTRSRKKVLAVALTFLIVTSLAYGLFIAGLFQVFYYIGYLRWIQILVALLAFLFGAVNVKDYFWYKKGLSFTISDKHKPKLFKDIRGLLKEEASWGSLILGTAIMALGVVLIELPCTAGFPVIWSNLISLHDLSLFAYINLLLVYLLIYLSIEIIVVMFAVVTMNIGRFQEKHGRLLKLIGGMIMLALAGMMIWNPLMMSDIKGTLMLFVGAIIASLIIVLIDRLFLNTKDNDVA